jgi:hypothetical protein
MSPMFAIVYPRRSGEGKLLKGRRFGDDLALGLQGDPADHRGRLELVTRRRVPVRWLRSSDTSRWRLYNLGMKSRRSLALYTWTLVIGVLTSIGCADGDEDEDDDGRPQRDDGEVVVGEGLSCEIAKTLETYCWSCHGQVPTASAPFSLLSRSELLLISAGQTRAVRAVTRMRAPRGRMPPAGPGVPEAEIGGFEAWIAAGTPTEQCAPSVKSPRHPMTVERNDTSRAHQPAKSTHREVPY